MPAAGPIVRLAPAKVNLCLHVTGRRDDGYHELDSLVAFADIADVIRVEPAPDRIELRVSVGSIQDSSRLGTAVVPLGTTNLAWRALAVGGSARGHMPGTIVSVEKCLPAGAGLGGGSSDAAAVLRSIEVLHGWAALPAADLVALGADVPMSVEPRPWRAQGLGDVLTPVRLGHDLPVVLVWPGRAASTPQVFRARTGAFGAPIPEEAIDRLAVDPIAALAGLRNDLTEPACRVEPMIVAALTTVGDQPRCRLARMTGSGSAVFGVFDDGRDADEAAGRLAAQRPDWWVRATILRADGRSGPP